MRILYTSDHEILEYDEVSLLTELGHSVLSWGAYLNPAGHPGLKRPHIPGAAYDPEFERLARMSPRTEIPSKLFEQFDAVIVMHNPNILDCNWKKMNQKKVIWRSIGQSNGSVERLVGPLRKEGLKVVRYSPKEEGLPNYVGADAMIRFYKDPNEYKDWNGGSTAPINFTQTLKGRRSFCHHDEIMELIEHFDGKVYGSGNEDLGTINGGSLPYEQFKQTLRDARVFVYGGTWPAPYTLSLIEAMMTGVPVVALGKDLAQNPAGVHHNDRFEFYEVSDIIKNGVNGFISNNLKELKQHIGALLSSHELANTISQAGRATAIDLFGKDKIKAQWADFLNSI